VTTALALVVIAVVAVSVHVSTMALTALALGHSSQTVSLFFGPVLLRRRIGRVNVQLGSIPLGGFVQFDHRDGLAGWPTGPRVLTLASGNLALLTLGVVLFGTSGPLLLSREDFLLLLGASPVRAMGWAAMAFAVVNLLPLPQLNGGQMVAALLSLVRGQEVRFPMWLSAAGTLLSLGLLVWWLVR
jgi:membrane-associated protease RseP (regulator of RpoE activity)